ncbi:hypothetical protein AX15_003018 [Amanita polypyramis BW_CC]|nr:hypothetical protein AX15_003018 [Amanita polypyramis BW_CC]
MTGPDVYSANTTPQYPLFTSSTDIGNYPPSPYRNGSPPPNAANFPPNTVQSPYSFDLAGYRSRAPSFYAPSPNPYPAAPPSAQPSPWPRQRRLSYNSMIPGTVPGIPYPPFPSESPPPGPYPDLPRSITLHPLLTGETPRLLSFNLADHYFAPAQLVDGQFVPLTSDILQVPATYPPVYRLRIVCDDIPEWPVALEFDPSSYLEQTGTMLTYPPPVSVGDVLAHIHRTLHERITHNDWARLGAQRKYRIAQAYTARCASAPTMRQMLENEGVKKVDYLLDNVWFSGLAGTGRAGSFSF